MPIQIVDQSKIGQSAMRIREVILPDAVAPYVARAVRFAQLATNHVLSDYLNFCAALCRAQDKVVKNIKVIMPEREEAYWQHCLTYSMPPLGAEAWPRDQTWLSLLKGILETLFAEPNLSDSVLATLHELAAAKPEELEQTANILFSDNWQHLNRAWAPFIGAALQVWFNRLAVQLSENDLHHNRSHTCPVCGSLPTASRLRMDCGGLRYLHCSLCETEWHHVRATCTYCDAGREIVYWADEQQQSPMKVESCGDCHSYLKWLDPSKDTSADILADDIATLSLDLMMDEKGFERAGPNLLFFPGR